MTSDERIEKEIRDRRAIERITEILEKAAAGDSAKEKRRKASALDRIAEEIKQRGSRQ